MTDRAPADVISFVAPALVGLAFNWLLLGILIVQVYLYSKNFPNDHWFTKFLVYGLFICELTQSGLVLNDAFGWMVYGWGIAPAISNLQTNWFDVPIMSGFLAAVVQLYFAWRIWKLGRSMIVTGTIAAGALLEGSGAIASGILAKVGGSIASVDSLFRSAMVWLVTSTIVDVLIAVSMTYLLLRHKQPNGRLNNTIDSIVRLSIETGSVTAFLAILNLILYEVLPGTGYFLAPADLQAKMYTNTLLVIFNNRAVNRDHHDSTVGGQGTNLADPSGIVFKVQTTATGTGTDSAFNDTTSNKTEHHPLTPVQSTRV